MFVTPKLSLKTYQIMFAWIAYLNTVILFIQYVYNYRDRLLAEAAFVRNSYVSQRQRKKGAEKKLFLLENIQIKIILDV